MYKCIMVSIIKLIIVIVKLELELTPIPLVLLLINGETHRNKDLLCCVNIALLIIGDLYN